MEFNPKISIVIPVYNGSKYLQEAIDSALGQTYKNIEVIIVNDGSTDGGQTEKIVKSYGDKTRYFCKENGGVASALNIGIKEMTGEYFSWLSHDDVYYPNKIEVQVKYLNQEIHKDKIILYSNYDFIDHNSQFISHKIFAPVEPYKFRYALITINHIHGCTTLIPKECFNKTGLFDEKLRTSQDYDMWFRLSNRYKFKHIPEILIKSREHKDQGSKSISYFLEECSKIHIDFLDKLSVEELLHMTDETSITSLYLKIGLNIEKLGYYKASFYSFELAQKYLFKDNFILRIKNNCLVILYKLCTRRLKHYFYLENIFKLFIIKKNKFANKNYKDTKELIDYNKKINNIIASSYDYRHIEIYNPIEQIRISKSLKKAISYIQSHSNISIALDFGAGTGNITKHLLEENLNVVASDISEKSIERLLDKIGSSEKLETVILNGFDLSNFQDNTFDILTTYGVLSHIPDYLSILREFVRIVKPGGIIFIDHEFCPSYWTEDINYKKYLEVLCNNKTMEKANLKPINESVRLLKEFIKRNFFYKPGIDGEIHIYKYDHIEWDKIKNILSSYCEIIVETDYLVCRETGKKASLIYRKWQDKCVDMRMVIFRKKIL